MNAPDSFESVAEPYRRELLAYCYRMVGSVHDAEDLVQETYLRAWRAYDDFEGRSSTALAVPDRDPSVSERIRGTWAPPLPSGLGPPTSDHAAPLSAARGSDAWLEPAPDRLFAREPTDPADIVANRADVRLAFTAALQQLSARQRAVLILRDVLGWRANQTADILGTTTTAVNSALVRARALLREHSVALDAISEPAPARLQQLLTNYVEAFQTSDMQRLAILLRADVELEMPPIPTWFTGRTAVAGFLGAKVLGPPGSWQMVPTRANGQPAIAAYSRGEDGNYHAHEIQVLTLLGDHVSRIVAFLDPRLPVAFGLPAVLGPLNAQQAR